MAYSRLFVVALRKESVDRNCDLEPIRNPEAVSLSARRAWIEIPAMRTGLILLIPVALRKESVDRNLQKLAEAIKPS